MQRRGRSRQVSLAALARKASEERARQRWAPVETTIAVDMRSLAREVSPSEIVIGGTSTLHSLPLQPETTAESSNDAERHCPPAQHSNIIDLTGAEFAFTPQFELSIQEIDVSSPEIYTYPPSISPSPMTSAAVTPDTSESHTSDSYFSTPEEDSPSPPLTLLDHLHIAYALDDLPLAKMLLLKMTQDVQDITSRTDPRLDAVKPEDFDVAFLPKGGLMTPEDEARLVERQEKERMRLQKDADDAREQARRHWEKTEYEKREQEEKERIEKEERERVERERAWEGWVEGVWGNAKKEMEKMKEMRHIAKRRQEDAWKACQERKRQEDERRRVIAERRRTNVTKGSVSTPLPRISYAHLPTVRPASLPSSQTELLYTLPNIPKLYAQRIRISRTSVAVPSSSTDYTPSHSCSVRKTITPSSSLFFAPQSLSNPNSTSSSSELDVEQRPSSAISVQEVLAAMRGELFPSEAVQPAIQRDCSQHTLHGRTKSDDWDLGGIRQRSKTPHHNLTADLISSSRSAATRRQKRDDALLADLLSTSNNQFGEDRLRHRRADVGKGKSKTGEMKKRVPLRMNSSTSMASAMSKSICADCSASVTSPSTMSSSSDVSRSGSWLSFMSSSSMSSVSTVPTTPSASMPGSSPPTKSSVRTGSVFSAWLKSVASQPPLSPVDLCPCDHLDVPCTYSAYRGILCRLIPVGKDESPLPLDFLDAAINPSPSLKDGEPLDMALSARSSKNPGHAVAFSGGSKTLLHSVTHFLDVARSFQSAYMHAAMFAAIASVPNVSPFSHEWDRENERPKQCKVGDHGGSEVKRRLRPVGCRVDKNEVSSFTSAIKCSQQSSDADVGQPATGEYFTIRFDPS
ncbi:hypothetical protein DFJ43DRAFT_1071342 [Lentinula guzmanii]|uniref:Uncharacterized protein n=1 Tax=Lentinula guzmanii TaxID=2804957 RepID=A0AA38N1E6_9AGAR|nr:hypothetical protein DFJ43DRAFT_1071342 [Lentinula guzmanii]